MWLVGFKDEYRCIGNRSAKACPGADVSVLSVFPGEQEVLFPPCTGFALVGDAPPRTGAGAGHVRVEVTPHTSQ